MSLKMSLLWESFLMMNPLSSCCPTKLLNPNLRLIITPMTKPLVDSFPRCILGQQSRTLIMRCRSPAAAPSRETKSKLLHKLAGLDVRTWTTLHLSEFLELGHVKMIDFCAEFQYWKRVSVGLRITSILWNSKPVAMEWLMMVINGENMAKNLSRIAHIPGNSRIVLETIRTWVKFNFIEEFLFILKKK